MSLQGPIVVVADDSRVELAAAIRAEGGTPIAECSWQHAAETIRVSSPAAVVIDEPATAAQRGAIDKIRAVLADMREPYMPVLSRVGIGAGPPFADALPFSAKASPARVCAQLSSALRVRTLHAMIAQRATELATGGGTVPALPETDPLTDAAVLVTGRGGSYPELCTAIGERVALIGSLSVETAARYLTSRALDGVIIGQGFGPATVNALLVALGEDARFRDLPVALIGGQPVTVDCSSMPNFEQFDAPPSDVVDWMLPLVRLHAFEARLQRQLAAINANGALDAQTGLLTTAAFLRDLRRTIEEARDHKRSLSLARLVFPRPGESLIDLDAARQIGRLIRSVDFACQTSDGSVLLAFPNTPLRTAHVIARRIANALKNNIIPSGPAKTHDNPLVGLATLSSADTADTLLARVFESAQAVPLVAAE